MPRLTPEQIEARRHGMGATDIVEVALAPSGDVPWEDAGPMRVFARKLGLLPEDDATPEQEWGHVQEEVLLRWYEREMNVKILPGGMIPCPDESWMWATIDAKQIGAPINVECKHVGRFMCREWDEHDAAGVPHHVRAQVVLGMRCWGARQTDVVADLGGSPPRVWRIAYDDDLASLLVDVGKKFWTDHVLAQRAPALDGSDACKAYLRAKYPKDERPMLEATSVAIEIAQRRILATVGEKTNKGIKATCDAQLMQLCGDAKGIRSPEFQFTWKVGADGKRKTRFTVITKKGETNDGSED